MLIQHIALVPEAQGIDSSELARVSAALQKQVTRDLSPAWGVYATVDPFPRLEDVPVGYWPILITRDLGLEGGVRLDRDGSPYAQIEHSLDWSLDASRACLEMLVNPFGKRTVSAPSPRSDQGRVEVVLEVCAPCADLLCAYAINDVLVSDFCLPDYYEEGPIATGKRLSLNGSVGAPFRVLPGGHLTWFDVVTESYWRRSHWGENPVDSRLGKLSHAAAASRELLPRALPARMRLSSPAHEAFQARVDLDRQHARRVSELRAMRLRASFLTTGSEPLPAALSEPVSAPEPMPMPIRVMLTQESREAELVTAHDMTELSTSRPSAVPPPLPRTSKPAPPETTWAVPQTTSTPPVTILREPDRAPRAGVMIAVGALAAAAAIALVLRMQGAPVEPMGPASATETRAEAANAPLAPASAPAPAAAPAVPTTAAVPPPVVPPPSPTPEAKPTRDPASSVATASTKAKRTKRQSAPSAPPPPAEPEVVAAPRLVVTPERVTAPPKPTEQAKAVESASIDDLIDTRR